MFLLLFLKYAIWYKVVLFHYVLENKYYKSVSVNGPLVAKYHKY